MFSRLVRVFLRNIQSASAAVSSQKMTAAKAAQTQRRHLIVVKQLVLIMMFYVIAFASIVPVSNGTGVTAWITYIYYVNHVVNFFIYLAVNKEFRNEAKNMINVIAKKVQPDNAQPIFTLK